MYILKYGDFGLSRAVQSSDPIKMTELGTYGFMAPEIT